MPGLTAPRDIESYGAAIGSASARKRDKVPFRAYLASLLTVIGHCCLVLLIAYLSIAFAHWEEVNEPVNVLDRAAQGLINMGAYDDPGRCWQFPLQNTSSRSGSRIAARYCELSLSSLTETRFRSLLASFGAPLCALHTILNWFDGKHFPLTASRSFFVVCTGREMEQKRPKLTSVDIASMIAMGAFFFYCGMWVIAILFMQLHDVEPGLPRLRVASQLTLCTLTMLTKLKPVALCFVAYATCCCVGSHFSWAGWIAFPCVLLLAIYLSPDPCSRRRDWFQSRPVMKHMQLVVYDWIVYFYDNM
mmetsp:Transcript_84398/g.149282  ORF Transcript_84398/g.149282 Transcript_84398/m.149282 type:complete len:304 (-) Transcript_84398:117-1028(-)|eukprot:CAMPEP_0197626654 /NCGR_PEP_ID=MMETSP1338-20131121/5519_1 /TAXON_ID=43686 ORGANISM="Pelagodinium beii, Strain RCC1491" /NCGR_SAMPLE_ID=MMETSP1338 /ASSEMBLY_ACC=CAM_ASM_000754 /LENGTH=303 /DNA_ID=CAMNT_0043197203 /DNA_START=108 /DNA_END=1019 /DNA_ORIENTATION=+